MDLQQIDFCINKNNMNQLDERKLVLIKFEPQQILFQHKETRVIYRYFNINQQKAELQSRQTNDILQRGNFFNKGVIYEKEDSNLQLQIQQRKRSFRFGHFSQEEILNTFLPLFSCLEGLHTEGIVHGAITLQNIVIVQGQVKLRDWLTANYQHEGEDENQDLKNLGKCMISCTFLTYFNCEANELDQFLRTNIEKYSQNFVIALLIFIKQLKPYYKHVSSILAGNYRQIEQLNQLYQALKPIQIKSSKKNSLQNNKFGDIKSILTFSPSKKAFIMHKRAIHYQNIQNKVEGDIKKIEKSKNNQKNISSVYELMNKKLNQEQKRMKEQPQKWGKDKAHIMNLSNFGVQNNSKKISFKERNSPIQKLRTYSKKK